MLGRSRAPCPLWGCSPGLAPQVGALATTSWSAHCPCTWGRVPAQLHQLVTCCIQRSHNIGSAPDHGQSVRPKYEQAVSCMQSYPEYCRQLLYASPSAEFLEALAGWERAYGKVHMELCPLFPSSCPEISGSPLYWVLGVAGGPAALCAVVFVHGRAGRRSGVQQERHVFSPQAPSHVCS